MQNRDRKYRVKFRGCNERPFINRLFLDALRAKIFCAAMNGELFHWEQNEIGAWNWVRME